MPDKNYIDKLAYTYNNEKVKGESELKFCKDISDKANDINEGSLRLKLVDSMRYCHKNGVNVYKVFGSYE